MSLVQSIEMARAERIGAEGNAVYYLTWTIAYSLYLVSKSMGMGNIVVDFFSEAIATRL